MEYEHLAHSLPEGPRFSLAQGCRVQPRKICPKMKNEERLGGQLLYSVPKLEYVYF